MHTALQYLIRAILFTIRYFIAPLIVGFGVMFFILTIPSITIKSINYYPIVVLSLLFGTLISTPFLFLQIGMKIVLLLSQKFVKETTSFNVRISKLKPSIRTRILLKKYFLAVSISMFLIAIVLIGNSIVTREGSEPLSLNFGIGYIFVVAGMFCLQIYREIYEENEYALFFMEKSLEYTNYCLEKAESEPNVYSFEKALRSYQKTMPSFSSIKNLNDRIKQTELVLKLGTKEEIGAIRDIIEAFTKSIREHDDPSFFNNMSRLNQLLEKFVDEKKDLIQLSTISNREIAQKSFIEAAKPIWNKVVPYLIIIAIFAVIYLLFGVNLARFFGFV
jgi:hypothetical protein